MSDGKFLNQIFVPLVENFEKHRPRGLFYFFHLTLWLRGHFWWCLRQKAYNNAQGITVDWLQKSLRTCWRINGNEYMQLWNLKEVFKATLLFWSRLM